MGLLDRIRELQHVKPSDSVAEIRKKQIGARGEWDPKDVEAAAKTYGGDKGAIPPEINELLKKQSGTSPLTDEERRKLAEWYLEQQERRK
jgi:hypothetical protein